MTKPYIINKEAKAVLIPAKYYPEISQKITKCKLVELHGKELVAIHFGEIEVRVLWELGFKTPTPFELFYQWKPIAGEHLPFKHQEIASGFMTIHQRCFNLLDMGLGKSIALLASYDYLKQLGAVKKMLILCPKSCMTPVWVSELFSSFPHLSYSVLAGPKKKRDQRLKDDVDIYISNHDSVRTFSIKSIGDNPKIIGSELDALNIDMLAVDEASIYKNMNTDLWRNLNYLAKPSVRTVFLTGSPAPSSPMDAYSIAKIIAPDRVPRYAGAWKRKTMMQMGQWTWIPLRDSEKTVYEALQPSIRFSKEQCLDLPEVSYLNREVELSTEQKKHLNSMRKEMVMEHDKGEISSVSAVDRLLKLRQILCGVVRDETGKYIELDYKPRLAVLEELISEAGGSVVIIFPFKGIINSVRKKLSKNHRCEIINGDVPQKKRDEIIHNFQNSGQRTVLLCHPKVMSHGLTLTKGKMIIWYSGCDSSELYVQANARLDRAGQKHNTTVVHMGASPIEWKIYKSLQDKKSYQSNVLEMYEDFISG